MKRSLQFFVPGRAEPGGSKRFIGVKSGKGIVIDANKNAAGWKERVALVASEAKRAAGITELWDCPLRLVIVETRARPRFHYNAKGMVRETAPPYPATKPDTSKIVRLIEDALSGILWTDDARVVSQSADKRWGEQPGVSIFVEEIG